MQGLLCKYSTILHLVAEDKGNRKDDDSGPWKDLPVSLASAANLGVKVGGVFQKELFLRDPHHHHKLLP